MNGDVIDLIIQGVGERGKILREDFPETMLRYTQANEPVAAIPKFRENLYLGQVSRKNLAIFSVFLEQTRPISTRKLHVRLWRYGIHGMCKISCSHTIFTMLEWETATNAVRQRS